MSSATGLRRTDGQRLPPALALISAAATPALQLAAKYPNAVLRGLISKTFYLLGSGGEREGVHARALMLEWAGRLVEARLYAPPKIGAPAPVLVYFHGGGCVLGSITSHDRVCRQIAIQARCLVLSVDYSLAPEHRFPVAFEDSLAAFRWTVAHAAELGADPSRVAVGGDSAGGGLAAAVALNVSDDEQGPCFVWMLYPWCDADALRYESAELFRRGPALNLKAMAAFTEHYAPSDSQRADPRLSIVHAESVDSMPPTYIATAGMDILRDQGAAFAARLREAGVAVQERCFRNLPHAFASLLIEPHARAACEEAIRALATGITTTDAAVDAVRAG